MQQAGTAGVRLDSMEFGRRLAIERELEKGALEMVLSGVGGGVGVGTAAWDESGKFVLYPTLLGIKGQLSSLARVFCDLMLRRNACTVVNTVTNKVARFLGKDETARFLNLALYQGAPIKQGITTLVGPTPDFDMIIKFTDALLW